MAPLALSFHPTRADTVLGMMNEHITPSHLSPYFTLGEAALYARCSTRTVQRWLSGKKLQRYGHGRLVLILKAELVALLSTPQSA